MTVARRYRLLRVVGEGGMGIVWAAHDLQGGDVALKFLKSVGQGDGRAGRRLLREAQVMAQLAHPNIATVHGAFETETGTPFLVMDLLRGEPLSAYLAREGAQPPALVACWMRQIIAAVRAAHEVGVVHRDLKPENVFLTEGPPETCVRVLDFGIAKAALGPGASDLEGASLTSTGAMLGTPYYMAPEQIFGDSDVDPRADVWALGIIIYECLTGRRPTQAKGMGQVVKIIVNGAIAPLEQHGNVPRPVSDVVGRMLSRDRDARPALSEVVNVLDLIEQMPAKEHPSNGVFPNEPGEPTLESVEVGVTSARRAPGGAATQRNAGLLRVLTFGGALVVGAVVISSRLARSERASLPARTPETSVRAPEITAVPSAVPVVAQPVAATPSSSTATTAVRPPATDRPAIPSSVPPVAGTHAVRAAATVAAESEAPPSSATASPTTTTSNQGIPSFERR